MTTAFHFLRNPKSISKPVLSVLSHVPANVRVDTSEKAHADLIRQGWPKMSPDEWIACAIDDPRLTQCAACMNNQKGH